MSALTEIPVSARTFGFVKHECGRCSYRWTSCIHQLAVGYYLCPRCLTPLLSSVESAAAILEADEQQRQLKQKQIEHFASVQTAKQAETDQLVLEAHRLEPTNVSEQPTLRDQFAMAALSSIVSPMDREVMNSTVADGSAEEEYYNAEYFAREAYRLADAMLVARSR